MSAREDIDAVNQYVNNLISVPPSVVPLIDSWKHFYSGIIVATDNDWTEAQTRRNAINAAIKTAQNPTTAPTNPAATPVKPGDGFNLNTKQATQMLQKVLNITQDGVFGSGTDAAVRKWQSDHKLKVDGIVGPKTWASLGYTSAMPQLKKTGAVASTSNSTTSTSTSTNKPSTKTAVKPVVNQAAVIPTGPLSWLKSLPWWAKGLGLLALGFGGYKTYEIQKNKSKNPSRY
jgi:peptidoglycan hydrolase-like protein with peptidoglycan-binding domain